MSSTWYGGWEGSDAMRMNIILWARCQCLPMSLVDSFQHSLERFRSEIEINAVKALELKSV